MVGLFDWAFLAASSRFLAWSTFSIEKVLHAENGEGLEW